MYQYFLKCKRSTIQFVAVFIAIILLISSCGRVTEPVTYSAPNTPAVMETTSPLPSPSPLLNGAWSEYASMYKKFYLETFAYAKSENGISLPEAIYYGKNLSKDIYYLSLLDLDLNGIPELIIYYVPTDVGYAAAVLTIENGEVCRFTEIPLADEFNIDVPESKNAVPYFFITGVLLMDFDQEVYQKNSEYPFTFLCYTDNETDSSIYLLHSYSYLDYTHPIVYRRVGEYYFTQMDGCLTVETIYEFESFYDDSAENDVDFYIDGNLVSIEEFNRQFFDWTAERDARYSIVYDIDYMNFMAALTGKVPATSAKIASTFFEKF